MNKKQEYIDKLCLGPHPEGGWYKETYHSENNFFDDDSKDQRYFYTSIYFLLDKNSPSHFHKLNHDELWYYHDGNTITIHCISPQGKYYKVQLGKDIMNGQVLQFKVPKNTIFASEINEDSFCLVSCMVSPGFSYNDFILLRKKELIKQHPSLKNLIERLTID
ncbi:cupin domain-containing protein [Apilactobacillus quenuiae]|uniref:cupin domain-containing protein n=1 Tax=Apilactobacillus quenuiae TaxID=2008377 RepID=UPI000D0163C5|nr:cupin domain-containing protein [Apilactobacillus quenuiae]